MVFDPMMKLPEAEAMGPPKVVVAVPVTAKDEVVAFVKRPMVALTMFEKKEFDDVAFRVLSWVDEATVAKR